MWKTIEQVCAFAEAPDDPDAPLQFRLAKILVKIYITQAIPLGRYITNELAPDNVELMQQELILKVLTHRIVKK